MAETAVSLASQHLLPKFLEAVNMLKDLPNEVADSIDKLEIFQDFINGADKVAEAEEDDSRRENKKKKEVKSIVHKERDGFKSVFPIEERPNNSRGNQHVTWDRYHMDPLYNDEDKVVGFDDPKDQLKD
ncbi:hypothetical protein Fmac_015201 [Flemingia macrophylla]|uniref:Uncharacterized protein n=1 Tax=Flemingia macrophylla TaxID=520843 RepID=A0ABD1MDW8_9FABA